MQFGYVKLQAFCINDSSLPFTNQIRDLMITLYGRKQLSALVTCNTNFKRGICLYFSCLWDYVKAKRYLEHLKLSSSVLNQQCPLSPSFSFLVLLWLFGFPLPHPPVTRKRQNHLKDPQSKEKGKSGLLHPQYLV